jgi:hypothetical protein
MLGTYKLVVGSKGFERRAETIRKSLIKHKLQFSEEVREEIITFKRCGGKCRWDCKQHFVLEPRSCLVIEACGTPKYRPSPKRKVSPRPERRLPPDWEWSADDLAFFEETAKLPPKSIEEIVREMVRC